MGTWLLFSAQGWDAECPQGRTLGNLQILIQYTMVGLRREMILSLSHKGYTGFHIVKIVVKFVLEIGDRVILIMKCWHIMI